MKAKNGLGSRPPAVPTPLPLKQTFDRRRLLVLGATGFLGKVWWVLMLHRFPSLERLYLVIRPRNGQSAEERFWADVAPSECLRPLREAHGDGFEAFLRSKLAILDGDIVQPFCGLSVDVRQELHGQIDAVVNASGVVDFQPPLDVALQVNAFGMQSLVALARDLGGVPILHTSTCYVAGYRAGIVEEVNPLDFPFPYAAELDPKLWDPDREIAECLDIIEQAKHRANDAFRESRFLDEAKHNLVEAGEPSTGAVLAAEIQRVRRKFVEQQLASFGQERAKFWGWPNTYTYTKCIGEQIVAKSKLPFTIVRPAIVESCVEFPLRGWNEGVNTSAPLIFAIREGQQQFPGSGIRLDIIPCDLVASGILLALAELLDGSHKPVYQFGTSDSNPTTMARIYELSGLYKRKYYQRTGRGSPLVNFLQAHVEGALMPSKSFERMGPRAISKGAGFLAEVLDKAPKGPVGAMLAPTTKNLRKFSKQQARIADIIGQFAPFTAELDYEFRCDNTRAAFARLSGDEKKAVYWAPESIDWREWFLGVHVPGLERWVFPELERRINKPLRPLKRHETLTNLLAEMAERHDLAVALQYTEPEGLSRFSYRDWYRLSLRSAARLEALGVEPGHRVVLCAKNHPHWPIAFFGILLAGATVVPIDAGIDSESARVLLQAACPKVALVDEETRGRLAPLLGQVRALLLSDALAESDSDAALRFKSGKDSSVDDVAVLIYTSGTSGSPKGVMLSHENLTSLLSSLAPLFPLGKDDRLLSVLPLHHTFELACGMLLPLSRGARIVYLDELSATRLESTLSEGRITTMVGVPALWEMLERKILARVNEQGPFAGRVFEFGLELNRYLSRNLGLDVGHLLFGSVHRALGGQLKTLVSGGAALNKSTHRLFAGLGLHLAEGYGLTEASPVLAVSKAGPRNPPGQVGTAIPGVELRIDQPDASGVGEIVARGPNVMLGYAGDPDATGHSLKDGWLHTGDLGMLDHRGRLTVVGRSKEIIVAANGENVYPDDVEARLAQGRLPRGVKELAVIAVGDHRGGERVALVYVETPEADPQRTEQAVKDAIATLPVAMRPAIVRKRTEALPRTTTRKLQRREVGAWLESLLAAEQAPHSDVREVQAVQSPVRDVLARVTRRDRGQLKREQTLRGDLGCDSLMLLDIATALEKELGHRLNAERFYRAETVGDVEQLLSDRASVDVVAPAIEQRSEGIELPTPLRDAGMALLGKAQSNFYASFMTTRVVGRAFIPKNKNVLVIANHASHLDMGLVKYALGAYGEHLVALAARDYFFEGKLKKAFFENFSNMVPVSRTSSPSETLEKASELLTTGNVVLLFPEGSRSPHGGLQEFKPGVGALALQAGVDILPIWLSGTFDALPKGATMLRGRKLGARIGPPLSIDLLRQHTHGLSPSEAARKVAALSRRAIEELSQGRAFELVPSEASPLGAGEHSGGESTSGLSQGRATAQGIARDAGDALLRNTEAQAPVNGRLSAVLGNSPLAAVFEELDHRFKAGSVRQPVRYYFSLGDEKFTLLLSPSELSLERGQSAERADCVLKTSPEMFRRMVMEGYTPSTREVLSGVVKTSNVPALKDLQRVFDLKNPRASTKAPRKRSTRGGAV